MGYVQFVQVFNAVNDLLKELTSFLLLDSAFSNDVVEELTATGVLHD